ncbi:MAG TPA: DUF4870 domain-containing protein [Puia sp.]|nr:DUF4870 domain-containing protein [Puia sp.]
MNNREQAIRTWSMLCHISALASLFLPYGNILGPLIVWQIKKNELPEIDRHGKESLNFQITMSIIGIIFAIFLIGSLGYAALFQSPFVMVSSGIGLSLIAGLIRFLSWILVAIAGIRAFNGGFFSYPSIKFIK